MGLTLLSTHGFYFITGFFLYCQPMDRLPKKEASNKAKKAIKEKIFHDISSRSFNQLTFRL